MTQPWIQTYTGKQFFPLHPRSEDICIRDIAHALSNICRFNGHSKRHYSVAEHSVRVCCLLDDQPPGVRLWGLLHDAAEAYLGDVVGPIKPWLRFLIGKRGDGHKFFDRVENQLLKLIAERFGLPWPMHPAVKEADQVMLATEGRDLLGDGQAAWLHELPKPDNARISDSPDLGWRGHPGFWEQEFLRHFQELGRMIEREQ